MDLLYFTLVLFVIGAYNAEFIDPGFPDPAQGFVSKCLNSENSSLDFSCPENHYMAGIYFEYGVKIDNDSSCSHSSENCHVTPTELRNLTNQCRWRNSCRLFLHTLVSDVRDVQECGGRQPDYVSFQIPKCFHEDHVPFACSRKNKRIKVDYGVVHAGCSEAAIKSHCQRRFQWKPNSSVSFRLIGSDEKDRVRVSWKANGKTMRANLRERVISNFNLSDGNLRLRWKRDEKADVKSLTDLRVYFSLSTFKEWGSLDDLIVGTLEDRISNVTANVTEVIKWNQKSLTFSCPNNSVVYSTSIFTGSRSRNSKKLRCLGLSSNILVQRNKCQWKQSCNVTWSAPEPIISSHSERCFGKITNALIYGDFKCINADSVVDMCDVAGSKIINQRKGVIRSHENYPWNYPEGVQCKIQVKVASNETLLIWKEMFEIDRSRDKLKAWHVHNETCETRKYLDKYEIRKPIRVTGGHLKLVFTSSKRSRSGKGFLLMFDRKHSIALPSKDSHCRVKRPRTKGKRKEKSSKCRRQFPRKCKSRRLKRIKRCNIRTRSSRKHHRRCKKYNSYRNQ